MEEHLIVLPQQDQVARGIELMSMLKGEEPPQSSAKVLSDAALENDSWEIVVKQTFIEVVIPGSRGGRRRAMSESALDLYEKGECMKQKLPDVSDVSTEVSLDEITPRETYMKEEPVFSSVSSEGEVDREASSPSVVPCQYVDSWYYPAEYCTPSSAMCSPSSSSFQPLAMPFAAPAFSPMQWVPASMAEQEWSTTEEWRTTVMIRNMPNNYTLSMFLDLVDSMGFAGLYNFAYLPIDFQSQAGLGYAFVNFIRVSDAQSCFTHLEGFSAWKVPSDKVCTVTWSSPTQGFEEHVERYRNSPVMHHSIPEEWKPVLFHQGMRVPFPPPTKAIKTPKIRVNPNKTYA